MNDGGVLVTSMTNALKAAHAEDAAKEKFRKDRDELSAIFKEYAQMRKREIEQEESQKLSGDDI